MTKRSGAKKKLASAKEQVTTKTTAPNDWNEQPLVMVQKYKNGKWSPFVSFRPEKWQNEKLVIPLGENKGKLTVFPNYLGDDTCDALVRELQESVDKNSEKENLFRVYETNNTVQPRAQFLLHKDARENFEDENPGYAYNRTTKMKANPLHKVKGMAEIWDKALGTCKVDDFKIGANVIYYRGSKDRMHYHADDSQSESVIFAVVVQASQNGRCVSIRANKDKKKKPKEGDRNYDIYPRSGDAYCMDGEMQKHYKHAVMSQGEVNVPTESRVVIVFRDGRLKMLKTDTGGEPVENLDPPPPIQAKPPGHCDGLFEGVCYSRKDMIANGFHVTQRGVSGSIERGCEAISLSGSYRGNWDKHDIIMYSVKLQAGGEAMLRSSDDEKSVRVFRHQHTKGTPHRFDGLYTIRNHFGVNPVVFELTRNPVGKGLYENREKLNLSLPLYGIKEPKKLSRKRKADE